MILLLLKNRVLENRDWITMLFVVCFVIIAIAKNTFIIRFTDYVNLIISDKYIRVYKDGSNLLSWFTIFLFLVQLISISLFIQYLFYYFLGYKKTDWITFIQIISFLIFFILSKFLIEKIIAELFKINEFTDQFNLLKLSYRTYLSIILLPVLLIMYYNKDALPIFIYITIVLFIGSNVLVYLNAIKIFQKLIFAHLFYFILYLCTLEIAPYYFIFRILNKS
jgi:Domain of unknown function (DUF4271)